MSAASKKQQTIVEVIEQAEKLVTENRGADAAKLYEHWIGQQSPARIPPAMYVAHFNLGVIQANLQQHAEAEKSYRASMRILPHFIQAHLNLGTVLERMGRFDEALAEWKAALILINPLSAEEKPFRIHALNNLGRLLEVRKDYAQALRMLTDSLTIDPKQPEAIAHWVHLRQKLCEWPAFKPFSGVSLDDLKEGASALAHLSGSDSPADQLAAARRYVAKKVLPLQTPMAPANGYNHPRLRIGYLSSDFCNHAVSILTAELYALHDRSLVEVYGFCWSRDDGSPLRARVVGAMDHYIPIGAMSDRDAAQCIRDQEIDILVDLHGLTLGTRHDILSFRPAPVQVTYLGFPGTTGMPSIDYVIADEFVLPETLAPYFSEKPLYLPGSFQINDRQRAIGMRPTRESCGLPDDAFVFCCFNSTFKITPEVFDAWMTILQRTPDSVLWLIADHETVRDNLLARSDSAGISPSRLIFAGRVAPENYLARYQVADLFLDTCPFNAGTTASDALWAGLPLLTLAGETFASRMAGSLLHAADLPELVTYDLAAYVEAAVSLAADRTRIEIMKKQLVDQRMICTLFDSPRLVRALEEQFLRISKRPIASADDQVNALADAALGPARKKVELFQIAYSDEVMAQIPREYGILDNRTDNRHDWREYWPMRTYLLNHELRADTYYGFFSPKFESKTGLSHQAVLNFIEAAPSDTDVFTFSPQPDMGSFFLNVFEQNELFDPGFVATANDFMAAIGRPVNVSTLVMDSRQIVFSNFIVARPAFWRAWVDLTEKMFAICEGEDSPLKAAMVAETTYTGAVQRKVFLIERLASLLLTISPNWRVHAYDTFQCAWSATKLGEHKMDAIISDALKIAMREQGYSEYATAFSHIRDRLRNT